MNKDEKIIVGGLAVIAILVMAYLFFENQELKKSKKKDKASDLKLIYDTIKKNPNFSQELKTQIEQLVLKFETVDKKISNELVSTIQLIQIGQIDTAIHDLAKIIENMLSYHYQNDIDFKNWLQTEKGEKFKNNFHGQLYYCHKEDKKITFIEFNLLSAIRQIRNKKAHELDINLGTLINAAGITSAIAGIIKLADLVYPQTND